MVIEIGAGSALPTVRRFGERYGPRVIRINAREAAIAPHIGTGIAGSAIDVLRELDSFSQERS
ncbi:silent information regulator protein Sir2 [Herbaspirillum sp. GW103]|nr:silent information regulator protein Sir2 [Herbaspirillum sp. GW103]